MTMFHLPKVVLFSTIIALALVLVGTDLNTVAGQETSKSNSSSELHHQLDQKMPGWLKQYDVPSVAVAYIKNGKLAWTAVYGEQSPGVPASEGTLYNVASLTKPISAEVILRLVSAGKISLDEPISAYWVDPDVKDNPWQKLLTPRLCLSHQTGFTNWRYQTNDVLKFQWEPGTRTGYSGEGYDYVARFAEKKLSRPFEELAQEYVFDPIGMKDTAYTARSWYAGRLAESQGPKGKTEPEAQKKHESQTAWTAANSLRATIGDYAKFLVSVMHNEMVAEPVAKERLTSTRNLPTREETAAMCAKDLADPAHCNVTTGLGLGWEVMKHNDVTIISHTGSNWGARTVAFFIPRSQVGVVIFTNSDNGNEVEREIVRLLYPDPIFIDTL